MFFRLEQCCANAAVPVLNSSSKMLCHVAFKIESKASLCHPAYTLSYAQFLSPKLPRSAAASPGWRDAACPAAGSLKSADWTAIIRFLSGKANFSSTTHSFSKIAFVWALGNFYSSLEFGWIEKHVQKLLGWGIKEWDPISLPYLGNQAFKKKLKKPYQSTEKVLLLGLQKGIKPAPANFSSFLQVSLVTSLHYVLLG